jgi:hypothetical protein
MNKKTTATINPEFIGMDAALKRAAKAAHTLARKTKTPCYIWKDGRIVDITAKQNKPVQGKLTPAN